MSSKSKSQTTLKSKSKTKTKSASAGKTRAVAKSTKKTTPVPPPQIVPPTPDVKAVYQAFVEDVLNGGKFELAEKYLDPVVVSHNPFPGQTPGIEGFVTALRDFRVAFPDVNVRATHYVAEGDKVVGRFEVTGTHRGYFMGLPPTGRPVRYEEIAIVRFAGGRIVEHWAVADALAIMQQLAGSENA